MHNCGSILQVSNLPSKNNTKILKYGNYGCNFHTNPNFYIVYSINRPWQILLLEEGFGHRKHKNSDCGKLFS